VQQGWERSVPFLHLDRPELEARLRQAMPDARVLAFEPIAQGLRNSSYRVVVAGRGRPVVARFFTADPTACRKEAALAQLLDSRVPIPRVLGTNANGDPPLTVSEWIDGEPLDAWLLTAAPEDARDAARSAGRVLAGIHAIAFPGPGFLGPDLQIVEPFETGGVGWASYVRMFLVERGVARLLGDDVSGRLLPFVERQAPRLDALTDAPRLVHADFKPPNLLVGRGEDGWGVTGVLDWEFALSGPSLLDVGLFLRFEHLFPAAYRAGFVEGYTAAGGELPDDWHDLARLLDLLNMCSLLAQTGDRGTIVGDVRKLILGTIRQLERAALNDSPPSEHGGRPAT
jgi:aminoglycoside phosphotransferase (APT) family kinase protein